MAEGLDAGLTVNEIKEILVQLYAYVGFPRSLNALGAFMGLMEERAKNGIHDEMGKEATAFPAEKSSVEIGTGIQTSLVGRPVTGPLFSFAPAIDQFLKGHLFGDIFGRDNLDFQSREIATIAALSGLGGVDSQLRAHFNVGFNVGLSEAEMADIISVIETKVGKKESAKTGEILSKVLQIRGK